MTLVPFTTDLIRADDILVFDYDGTLSSFVADPTQAIVPPDVVDHLGALARRQPVIVITGRQISEIDRFLSPLTLPVSGAHGRQFRASAGSPIESPPLLPLPQTVRDLAEKLTQTHPGSRIEIKDEYSFGFHVRPMAAKLRQPALDEFWAGATGILTGTTYKLQPGTMVIEVCPAGFDKGQALARFLTMPEHCGKRAIYFGDDLTDEYAFRTLAEEDTGFGVLVGPRALDPLTTTVARYMLESPEAMRRVLGELTKL